MDLDEIQAKREMHTGERNTRFRPGSAMEKSKALAREFGCDIAIPNGDGVGNVLCFTRVVEELARLKGRRLKILTAPISPTVGVVESETEFPIWENNPFVESIVNANSIDKTIIKDINSDQDNCFQFSHFIQNLCYSYGVRTDIVKPSIHLTLDEKSWAFNLLSDLQRPVVAVHPSGTSTSKSSSSWHVSKWVNLVNSISKSAGVFNIGKVGLDVKDIGGKKYPTTLRQLMSVIWASDIFIGFDSGPAHIARAFDKPSAIIWDILRKNPIEEHHQEGFGASAMTRWHYQCNFNLMLLGERDDEALDLMIDFSVKEIEKLTKFRSI